MNMDQRSVRAVVIAGCIIVSAFFAFFVGARSKIFYGDAMGYYLYLPATFIHHNLDSIGNTPMEHAPEFVKGNFQGYLTTSYGGKQERFVIQYTYGNAIMEFPFFLCAHLYEKAAGLPAAGFSDNYQSLIKFGTFLYGMLALLLLYRILRRYFNSLPSLLSVAFVFIGTNLFWFMLYQSGMAHVHLFFLVTVLMHLTIRLHDRPSTGMFLVTGLVAGLIVLIRPSDIVVLLIPLLFRVYNRDTFLQKLGFIREHFLKMVAAGIVMALLWIPQFLYWKALTGHYFHDSYRGQAFNWSDPKIVEGLFYASNGWLFYSPIMAFSLLGFFCYKKMKYWAWGLYTLFPVYVYVIYSWFCFNYINGLGSRPMIHIYPLLAIPLAAFIFYVLNKGTWLKVGFATVCLFFIAINISYSVQQAKGLLNSEESNLAFNMQMLFRYQLTENDRVVKDVAEWQPDTNELQLTTVLSHRDFNTPLSTHYKPAGGDSNFIYEVAEGEEYVNENIELQYDPEKFKDAKWIKCSGEFMCPAYYGKYGGTLLVLHIRRGDETLLWKGSLVSNKIGDVAQNDNTLYRAVTGEWGTVSYYVKVPRGLEKGDVINVLVWNMGKHSLYVDDLLLELYRDK
jgi:hypothetical protein